MVSLVIFVVITATVAQADLDGFLKNLNSQAQADMKNFTVKLSTQFGIPLPQVETLLKSVSAPADAFMVYQLHKMTNKPPETVLQTYNRNQKKGWGVMAKKLGIKPGSPQFHALKRGDLHFTGAPGSGEEHGHRDEHGKGKGKGKGHNK